jgi:hypothetical protein
MPPVLNVTLLKLVGAGTQNLRPRKSRVGVQRGAGILKLVTKTIRAAALI